ncbi:MAG: hypothetical protein LBP80_07100 [Treponema sp.]|nr:hypothetical protein [Treponema sp.]
MSPFFLSFVMCIAMSGLGGLITVLINALSPPFRGSPRATALTFKSLRNDQD